MKISATYNQQLTERIHMVMVRKFLILRSEKSISDRLLENIGCFGGQTIANDADAPMWGKAISKTRKRDSDSSHG